MKAKSKVRPIEGCLRFWLIALTFIVMWERETVASPTTGAHALSYYAFGQTSSISISTPAMNTQPSGSTMVVSSGRGDIGNFPHVPTDNMGNSPYIQLGPLHNYDPLYPGSGTALYAFPSANGGVGHVVTSTMVHSDEVTLDVVEVKNGGLIQDFKWNAVLKGNPLTSLNVTTTGPATLVAFWWGDGNEGVAHVAIPNNGFTVIDSLLIKGGLVQSAVATKDVAQAGSYNVTWDSAGQEGAQLYLVAVQSQPAPPLQIQASGSNVVVSWPTSAVNYSLEMTSRIIQSNTWAAVTNMPSVTGSQNTVTNPISPGNLFYRLKKP
jgi:hypothetical protein